MKKAVQVVIINFLIIFLLCGCGKMQALVDIKDNLNFKVYTSIKLSDLVNINNGFISDDKEIFLSKIGENSIEINYQDYKKHNGKVNVSINVYDDTPPFLSMSNNIYKLVDTDFNLCNSAFYGDNYDRNVACIINGDYDKDTVGAYKLNMVVRDESGNETNKDFTLHVIKEFASSSNNNSMPTGINFSEAVEKYKNDNTMLGIDVSSFQGEIDWEKVKNAGVEFAIIRLGFGYTVNMELVLDKYFQANLEGAKNQGLKVGVYFYTYANTLEEIEEQAKFINDNLHGEELELGVTFDWENWNNFQDYQVSFYDLNNMYDNFSSILKNKGYDTMLYGSKFYLSNVWSTSNRKIWLAHYTSMTNYDKDFKLWQFSDKGLVDGINGFVDLDILYN